MPGYVNATSICEARSRAFSLLGLEPLWQELFMSRNYYGEINLHLVWHTKNSRPLLTQETEPLARRFLKKRIIETPSANADNQRVYRAAEGRLIA
jgi:hypothetical protein